LVPAVRSLDCVSVFALTCADAWAVLEVLAGFDPADAYAREAEPVGSPAICDLRVGVPGEEHLRFFGDGGVERRYREALVRLEDLGCTVVEVDFGPFREVAGLLYGGPYVAERYAAVGEFLERAPEAVHPVVRQIIEAGGRSSAVEAYRAEYRLRELRRATEGSWRQMDVLAVPTAGTIYTVAEVEADPIALNANLGYYTNFANLLDLSAISVPVGFGQGGLPVGLSLIALPWRERLLCRLGAALQADASAVLGATGLPLSAAGVQQVAAFGEGDGVCLAVVGAHLSGQPLNHQLTDLGGTLVRSCRTAPLYRLYALAGTGLPKPGLVRVGEGGSAIELEVWRLGAEGFGRFVSQIPPPLGIGTLVLEDLEEVKGFLCEPYALADAQEITDFGGWRAYLASRRSPL
jgi:allophanate hydrolase